MPRPKHITQPTSYAAAAPSPIKYPNKYKEKSESGTMLDGDSKDGETFENLVRKYVAYKNSQTRIGLILFGAGIGLYLCLVHVVSQPLSIGWLAAFSILIALTIAKRLILQYRAKMGWFGNNEYEATELVRFFARTHQSA